MARKSAAALKVVKEEPKEPEARLVGKVELRPIESVKANAWNPNEFSPEMLSSLKHGLKTDGWLVSQSLLIWGTDEKGKAKNIIIDGEHRWLVGTELGFKKAPMVFLNGLTEAQAKALTVKMDNKRGKFNEQGLGELLRDIQHSLNVPDLAFDLGMPQEDFMKYLAMPPVDLAAAANRDLVIGTPPGDIPSGMQTFVKQVQLFFDQAQLDEYNALVKELAPIFNTKNLSDTSLEALRRVHSAQKSRR